MDRRTTRPWRLTIAALTMTGTLAGCTTNPLRKEEPLQTKSRAECRFPRTVDRSSSSFRCSCQGEQNPDQPNRPINSPKWNYQITAEALAVIQKFGTSAFDAVRADYLSKVPGLKVQYAAARELNRIPITLPTGDPFTLSPGGQNVLIKQMVEEFCPRFTPGGHVLYVGDADAKWALFKAHRLAELGVTIDQHGKMPDLVVHLPDRDWLILMGAVSSHGPVDAKRHGELAALFKNATPGLVYISCFPDRKEMRKYLEQIAWETDVWCAEDPTHLIHFNGERFLGPYM